MSKAPDRQHELRSDARLVDRFGRVHDTLRLSVTDRCNLRCRYCMPEEGMEFTPRRDILDFEALTRVVEVAARLGVERVRVTGGEPLLREDLPTLVRMIRARTGVRDISLTTNGVLLDRHAEALARAGLDRVNISLDSLEPGRFAEITRFGALDDVWRGVRAADDAGLRPIKINTLLLDGFNDDEIDAWLDLTRERDITVRFMELMPMGRDALADVGDYLDLTALRERLERTHGLRPARPGEAHIGNGPARYWRLPGARGTVGFITPISHGYCGTCSRLRMTCTGELRACLAHDRHVGLAHAARRGDDDAIEAALRWAVGDKPFGHHWPDGQHTDTGMSELGG